MPRQARKESGTGIYHVMLRGINRQDIFEETEDYVRMLSCMQQMLEQYDDQGNRLPPLCTFYAYCLMSNHVHLLLRVNQEDIGSTIKHLAVMYAIYYNQKYSRFGHVFQDRFKSEPVNDMAYFVTLLRYIHQNRRTKQAQSQARLSYALQEGGRRQSTRPRRVLSVRLVITNGAVGRSTPARFLRHLAFVPPTQF